MPLATPVAERGGDALTQLEGDCVRELELQGDTEALAATVPDEGAEEDGRTDALASPLGEMGAEADGGVVADVEGEGEGEGSSDEVAGVLGDAPSEADGGVLPDAGAEALCTGEALTARDCDARGVADALDETDRDRDAVTDTLTLLEGE